MERASISQLLMPLMGSEDVQNMLKIACAFIVLWFPVATNVIRVRYV